MSTEFSALSVLYLGETRPGSTARHRAEALRRLGARVTHLNPSEAVRARTRGIEGALHYRTGFRLLQGHVRRWLTQALPAQTGFDLCWVDAGELLGPGALAWLRQKCGRVVLFNHDDFTGSRDGQRFAMLRQALPAYDVCVVVRDLNVRELSNLGARQSVKVWMSYDEVAHCPPADGEAIPDSFRTDVAFVGTLIPGEHRDRFVHALIEQGLNVAIWGNRWERSPLWPRLRTHWRGNALAGREYVFAMAGAKVSLGLLSKGNRDEHTTRSMEIPYAGGLLCAQRTGEHRALYEEDREAVFWSDADECARQCRRLLTDDRWRESVRHAGAARVRANHVGNEDLCRAGLRAALALSPALSG